MKWPFGNRHKHTWSIVNVSVYESITGPRTIVGYRCSTCGKVETGRSIRGEWTVEQLRGVE